MRFSRAAALCVLVLLVPVTGLAAWRTSGPAGTRANAVSAAADDPSVAYAAATIFEASTSALYRTTDAGGSWTAVAEAAQGDSYAQVFADPAAGGRVFAALQKGNGTTDILRSLDSGENWSPVLTVSIRCVPSFEKGSGVDSLLFTCGTRFFRTADAGISWEEPATPFTENVRLTAGGGGAFYAYGVSHIFRSANQGSSWVEAGAAPPACPGLLSLRIDAADPLVFVAGTGVIGAGGFSCGGVYRSANAGASWSAPSLSGVYVTDLAVDPTDASRIYACASYIPGILPRGGVYVSGDGGRSFGDMRLPTTGALDLAVSASGGVVHAATPIGVYEESIRRTRVVPPR